MLSLAQTLKALSQNIKTVKDNLTSIKNQIVTTIKVINVLAKELGIESGLNDNGESNGKTPGSMTQPQNGGVSITNKETKDVVSKLKHVMQRSEAGQIFKSDGTGGMVPSEIFEMTKDVLRASITDAIRISDCRVVSSRFLLPILPILQRLRFLMR